jgi:hypothetical protein
MAKIITKINLQTLSRSIWEVTNVAVGPSAPPIMPTDEDSLLQLPRHNTRINDEMKIINFFIHGYSFVKIFQPIRAIQVYLSIVLYHKMPEM